MPNEEYIPALFPCVIDLFRIWIVSMPGVSANIITEMINVER
jgi:hypothetical protein